MKRVLILLIIAMFLLVGCGGGGGDDAADSGGDSGGGDDAADNSVMPENATDKGAIEIGGDAMEGEIENEDDVHSYTLTATEGDALSLKVNATGSAFTSPYLFLYDAEGALVGNTDLEKSSRSDTLEITIEADGDYTIIIKAVDGKGEEPYAVVVEEQE